jgi:hypothetical protein
MGAIQRRLARLQDRRQKKMMKLFGIYSAAILLLFALGAHEGYAVNSLFGNHHHGKPGEPGGYHGPSYLYHK